MLASLFESSFDCNPRHRRRIAGDRDTAVLCHRDWQWAAAAVTVTARPQGPLSGTVTVIACGSGECHGA